MSKITYLTDDLYEQFVNNARSLDSYLFLETHPSLPRTWKVEGEDPTFKSKLAGAISRFGTVSVFGYERFAQAAEEAGYTPLFMEDPTEIFDWKASLSNAPGVAVNSMLDGRPDRNGNVLKLVDGFLPFQAAGLNFMRSCDRCVYYQWSTGTGKTLAAEGTILVKKTEGYGPERTQGFDLCLYVVKPNNLYGSQRKLSQHTALESTILTGTPKKREKIFAETALKMLDGEQPILIFNAEKFREDKEFFKLLVTDKNVLVIVDEMPEKYANRASQIYRATAEIFYTTFTTPSQGKSTGKQVFYPHVGDERTAGIFWVGMCATPFRNHPGEFFNSVRLMDSRVYGSINDFNNRFVGSTNQWGQIESWQNLDLLGAMAAHIVHQADKKTDPAIAAQFPVVLPPEDVFCDMLPQVEKLYGTLQNEYKNIGHLSMLDFDEILAAIGCFQMIVDNPRGVLHSAKQFEAYLKALGEFTATNPSEEALAEFEKKNRNGSEVAHKLRSLIHDDAKFTDRDKDGNCVVSKMIELRDRILNHDDKVIVFSTANETLLPYITEWFETWGITYVTYHGGLNSKQKQDAQDAFRNDPAIKVFLGTDAGKDSIDLPEASLTIHYNLPWTWAGREQRENRQHRIDSLKDSVQTVTLKTPFTIEDRKDEIIATKQGYHNQVFGGAIADQAAELTRKDFLYILTGERS